MTIPSKMTCLACGSDAGFKPFTVREAMLGIGDYHDYGECRNCGSVQNLSPPQDLGSYYPAHYYSLTPKAEHSFKSWLRTQRACHGLGAVNPMGAITTAFLGEPYFVNWLKRAQAHHNTAILDVGCGSGTLLRHLKACGYGNLTGVDPFLPHSSEQPGLRLLKVDLGDVTGAFDLIMFHHSLEHVPHPLETLRQAARLLTPKGLCLVRTPVTGTWAWQTYGTDWVQLDAPRHLWVPSLVGMQHLVQRAGLSLQETQFDSDRFQILGSEKIKRGHSFNADAHSLFSHRQLQHFDQQARQLNADHQGDQACFWLGNSN